MAVITLRFNSQTLGLATQVRIIIPTDRAGAKGTDYAEYYASKKDYPVLWLLHGGTDNYADWHNCTPLEVLSEKYGYAVVCPDAQLSSYANMAYGPKWLDYFRNELPEYIYTHFPISRAREDNFVSGMSMGGAGALKLSLHNPERYSVCVPISSGVEVVPNYAAGEGRFKNNGGMFTAIYGHEDNPAEILGSEEDLYFQLKKNVEAGIELPKYLMCVGLQDFTRQGNIDYREYAASLGVDIEWYEEPGMHDWDSWNKYIPKVFEFISRCRG